MSCICLPCLSHTCAGFSSNHHSHTITLQLAGGFAKPLNYCYLVCADSALCYAVMVSCSISLYVFCPQRIRAQHAQSPSMHFSCTSSHRRHERSCTCASSIGAWYHVKPCRGMSCHAKSYYAMLCHFMLCHVHVTLTLDNQNLCLLCCLKHAPVMQYHCQCALRVHLHLLSVTCANRDKHVFLHVCRLSWMTQQ